MSRESISLSLRDQSRNVNFANETTAYLARSKSRRFSYKINQDRLRKIIHPISSQFNQSTIAIAEWYRISQLKLEIGNSPLTSSRTMTSLIYRVIPTMPSTEGWSWWPEGRFPCSNASRLSMYSMAFRNISTFGKRWLGLLLVRLFSTSKASLTCNPSGGSINRVNDTASLERDLREIKSRDAFVSRENLFRWNFISRLNNV